MAVLGPERDALGKGLKRVRQQYTGMSGVQFAARLGWPQPRLSRFETGDRFPGEDDIQAWVAAAGAGEDELAALLALRERAAAAYESIPRRMRRVGGYANIQAEIARAEREATAISKFVPAMIPGWFQTPEYVRAIAAGPTRYAASDEDVDAFIAARVERQRILYEPGRTIHAVLLEAALTVRLAPGPVMAGQLDRLAVLGGLPCVKLGIIPAVAVVPVPPVSGFTLYDDSLVVIEAVSGETPLPDPGDVAQYGKWFELLAGAAVYGPGARDLISDAIRRLR